MRYKIYGFPVPYKGKPIWEIVGNLKNFGIGRYIVEDSHKGRYTNPTFYKIVRVQPMETPEKIGHNRYVLLWAEYVLNGKKLTQLEQLQEHSSLTKFHLIPKDEEHKYLSGITTDYKVNVIPKYQTWPPLYKIILEQKILRESGKASVLPPLPTIIDTSEKSFEVLTTHDATEPPPHSDFFKTEKPVVELLKKIVVEKGWVGEEDIPEK